MSRKAETTAYTGINNTLAEFHPHVYFEKMYNPLRGGTPDMYYDYRRNLWVEYKYAALPARDTTVVQVDLSKLQDDWLSRQFNNGLEPWVIVCTHLGRTPMGVIITEPAVWRSGMPCGSFKKLLKNRRELADEIAKRVSLESKPKGR